MGCNESNQTYFFQTPHIIHMTKSQSVSRIVKRYHPLPHPFIVFWQNKKTLKYIADHITNQMYKHCLWVVYN